MLELQLVTTERVPRSSIAFEDASRFMGDLPELIVDWRVEGDGIISMSARFPYQWFTTRLAPRGITLCTRLRKRRKSRAQGGRHIVYAVPEIWRWRLEGGLWAPPEPTALFGSAALHDHHKDRRETLLVTLDYAEHYRTKEQRKQHKKAWWAHTKALKEKARTGRSPSVGRRCAGVVNVTVEREE